MKLPITVFFPGIQRKPVTLKQQFELLRIEPNFIFGTDILPTLFKDDEFTQYMKKHASITSQSTVVTSAYYENDMDVEKSEKDITYTTFVLA